MADIAPPTAPATPAPTSTPQQNTPPPQTANPAQGGKADAAANAAIADGKSPAAAPDFVEIKSNGRTLKVSKEEHQRLAQLGYSAQERFEIAAQKERKLEQAKGGLKSKMIATIRELNPDLTDQEIKDQFEDWYMQKYVEPETLTPEQIKQKERDRRLAELEAKEKDAQTEAERIKEQENLKQLREHYQGEIIQAMESGKFPKTPSNVRRLANLMKVNQLKGIQAPMDLLVRQAKAEVQAEDAEVKGYTFDQFVDRFGEDIVKMIRTEDLRRLREGRKMVTHTENTKLPSKDPDDERRPSMSDVNRRLRDMAAPIKRR